MRPFVIFLLAILLLRPLNAQEMYTLETCETDIATDVPQFFHDYFQCVTARMSTVGDDGRQYDEMRKVTITPDAPPISCFHIYTIDFPNLQSGNFGGAISNLPCASFIHIYLLLNF